MRLRITELSSLSLAVYIILDSTVRAGLVKVKFCTFNKLLVVMKLVSVDKLMEIE